MNKYKIDYNRYAHDYPYALFAKLHWYNRWEHVSSFKTRQEAKELFEKVDGLPVYLN